MVESEYNAGNSPRESTVWIDPDDPDALNLETLQIYARRTALQIAGDLGVPHENVHEDEDLRTNLEENEENAE